MLITWMPVAGMLLEQLGEQCPTMTKSSDFGGIVIAKEVS